MSTRKPCCGSTGRLAGTQYLRPDGRPRHRLKRRNGAAGATRGRTEREEDRCNDCSLSRSPGLSRPPASRRRRRLEADRPITIIVPWAAGGSTDQVTRVTAAELEKALGQKVVVVNQPGASGSIGTKNALEARRRTATPGPPARRRTSAPTRCSACSTRRIKDWHLFLTVANVPVVGVNPDTPVQELRPSCSTR